MSERSALQRRIRAWLTLFLICLVLSGLTAFPLVTELHWANSLVDNDWLRRVGDGLDQADAAYPFLLYGTDWLAFAHLVIAVFFYGVHRDPVRNIWIVEGRHDRLRRSDTPGPDLRPDPGHPPLVERHRHGVRRLRGHPPAGAPPHDQAP